MVVTCDNTRLEDLFFHCHRVHRNSLFTNSEQANSVNGKTSDLKT
jgi:hypothetical protein